MIVHYFYTYLIAFLFLALFVTFAMTKFMLGKEGDIAKRDFALKSKNIPIIFMLVVFYALYISMIPIWEEFTYQDHSIFFSTLKDGNQFYPTPIWYGAGRFFPLAHQEFTYIAKINASNFAYHFFAVIEMILIYFIFIKLFSFKKGTFFFVVLSITPAFVQTFFGLIYPERNLILLLLCAIAFLAESISEKSKIKLIISILFFSLSLFYKETAFLITLGVAASLLLSYILTRDNKLKIISAISLIFISTMWVLSYTIDIYPNIKDIYGSSRLGLIDAVALLIQSPWFYLSLISLFIFISKQRNSIYILFPLIPIGYSLVMYILNFKMPYYHLPSCVISMFCIFINASEFKWQKKSILLMIPAIISISMIGKSLDIIKWRKEMIFAKADAADYIYKLNKLEGKRSLSISFNNSNANHAFLLAGYIEKKYKISIKRTLGNECKDSDYAIYLDKKPKSSAYYTSQSVPMWDSRYKVYVVKCK